MKLAGLVCGGVVVLVACNSNPTPRGVQLRPQDADTAIASLQAAITKRVEAARACRATVASSVALPEAGSVKTLAPATPSALRATPRWEQDDVVVLDSPLIAPRDADPCGIKVPDYAWQTPLDVPDNLYDVESKHAWALKELAALGPEPTFQLPTRVVVSRTSCDSKPKQRYVIGLLDEQTNFTLDAFTCRYETMWVELETGKLVAALVSTGSASPDKGPEELTQESLQSLNEETERNATMAAIHKSQAAVDKWSL